MLTPLLNHCVWVLLHYFPLFKPMRMAQLISADWVCPWCIESKSSGGFFRRRFIRSFNHRPQWITQFAGIFAVSVIDAPQQVSGFRKRC